MRVILILCLFLQTFAVSALNLKNIQQVYFFGDSLTDAGYMDNSQHYLPAHKRPIYTTPGGHVWAYYLAKRLGFMLSANNLNPPKNNAWVSGKLSGNDYAAGGARAPEDVLGIGQAKRYNPPALQWQVQNYLRQHHRANPHALYFIWIGANDILAPVLQKHALHTIVSIHHSVTALIRSILSLQKAGAKHIIVLNLPPIGDTPLMNGSWLSQQLGNWVSRYYDTDLRNQLRVQQLHIPIFNTYRLFMLVHQKIQQDGSFAFQKMTLTNMTDSACAPHQFMANVKFILAINCLPPKNINYSQYVFADWVHPSDVTQKILADRVWNFLQQLPN